MGHKIFTPAEATQTLPLVKQVVQDILALGRELRGIQAKEIHSVDDQDRFHVLAGELEDLFGELEEVGCSFRAPDFEYGLVDFPSIIDGEPVHLCWRDDEPELRYYHGPLAGFAGRKPIPGELLSASE